MLTKKHLLFLIICFFAIGLSIFAFSIPEFKNVFSKLNPFRATIAPLPEDQRKLSEELAREIAQEQFEQNLVQIQEKVDELSERIDILEGRLTELTEAESLSSEVLETEEEPLPEESEDEEEETTKEKEPEEIEQKICEKITGTQPLRNKIIINEVAWMGTSVSVNNEWIELKNISGETIHLESWQILDKDKQIKIFFSDRGRVFANSFFLLERTDDNSVANILADFIYAGTLSNTDEALYLFDENCQLQDMVLAEPNWPAGDSTSKRTMERKPDLTWQTSLSPGGTPKAPNSSGYVVTSQVTTGSGGGAPPPVTPQTQPQITLSYSKDSPVNKEIKVTLSLGDFKNATHDLKISIEKDGVLSEICKIYNFEEEDWQCSEDQWQSSNYYLSEVFLGQFFEGKFLLRIKEDKKDFRGEADIVVKVRETEKTSYFGTSDKINIIEPEEEEEEPEPELPSPNLLLNEFFEQWVNGVPVDWVWNYTLDRIGQDDIDPLIGQYNVRLKPIASHNILVQMIDGVPGSTYYGEVWAKGTDGARVRVGIRRDGDNAYGPYVALEGNEWTKITWSRDSVKGEDDGILISVIESVDGDQPPVYIGAAWFSTNEPPENWPFQ